MSEPRKRSKDYNIFQKAEQKIKHQNKHFQYLRNFQLKYPPGRNLLSNVNWFRG